jgi:hypothetical protein
MSIDDSGKRVIFEQWGEIRGVGAELLITLAAPFREASKNELPPERYPYLETSNLERQLNCGSGEALRRRILRCRNEIKKLAKTAGEPEPPLGAVIESSQWRGYLSGRARDTDASLLVSVRRGLADVGYAEGRNVAIDYLFTDGRYDPLSAQLTDLTQRKVGVIVLAGFLMSEELAQQVQAQSGSSTANHSNSLIAHDRDTGNRYLSLDGPK